MKIENLTYDIEIAESQKQIARLEQALQTIGRQKDEILSENAVLKFQLQTANDALAKSEEQLNRITQARRTTEDICAIWRTRAEQLQEQLNTLFNKFRIKEEIPQPAPENNGPKKFGEYKFD